MSDLIPALSVHDAAPDASWDEVDRLRALEHYRIIDTPNEADFDDLVQLAARLCNTSAAAISLVTEDRQWFKAEVGLGIRQTSREVAFCAHAIHQPGLFVVPDATRDARFSSNPLVTENPRLRFYAGVPLETPQGLPLGTLCVLDFQPRNLSEHEAFVLRTLAAQVMTQLELRRALREQRVAEHALRAVGDDLERQVAERTAELSLANARLTAEMAEREQAEARLRQVQKMEAVGQLTSGIAHDFNNMLGGIIGGLELMQRRIASGRIDQLGNLLKAATTSAQRGAAMTQRLLSFSRQQSLDPKPVDVNRLVTSMAELLHRTVGESIHFEAQLAADLWNAIADENQLESVLLNLVINARDAMPTGGNLWVETSNAVLDREFVDLNAGAAYGDYIKLSVRDDGCGMTPDVMSRAFDPFFTTKRIGEGTGLGLSMVYGFARQSDGYVRIDSSAGAGTCVSLYLPRQSGAASATQPLALQPETQPSSAGETILVVDDDDGIRALLIEILSELQYRVIEARDGHAAIAQLESGVPIRLLITDVGLPGINGRDVAQAGRKLHRGLKVLMITGYGDNNLVRKQELEPGTELMSKPFSLDALAAKVGDMLAADRGVAVLRSSAALPE